MAAMSQAHFKIFNNVSAITTEMVRRSFQDRLWTQPSQNTTCQNACGRETKLNTVTTKSTGTRTISMDTKSAHTGKISEKSFCDIRFIQKASQNPSLSTSIFVGCDLRYLISSVDNTYNYL